MILFFVLSAFAADPTYQQPPADIQAILDADSPPAVQVSPDRGWMLELERPTLRLLAELAILTNACVSLYAHNDFRLEPFRSLRILGEAS